MKSIATQTQRLGKDMTRIIEKHHAQRVVNYLLFGCRGLSLLIKLSAQKLSEISLHEKQAF